MAVQQINFTRGGIDYVLNIGIGADGNAVDYIDQVQPDSNGNLLRFYPAKTMIERDTINKRGGVSMIHTQYFSGVVGGNGEIIEGSDKPISFLTGALDITYFVAGLGNPIMKSGNNGLVRNPWGFNDKPIFDQAGNVIVYTAAQETEPPTNDYWQQTNP